MFSVGTTVEVMFNRRWQRATVIESGRWTTLVDLEGRKVRRENEQVRLPITNRG